LCANTAEDKLVSAVSKIAWESKKVPKISDEIRMRETANRLAMESAKYTLDLLRLQRDDIAVESGMTAVYLFFIGEHYSQVISCSEELRERIKGTRFEDDLRDYIEDAHKSMKSPDLSKRNGKINALYSLICEKGVLGTTSAMREMKDRFKKTISNPTINLYSKLLHRQNRAYRLGGPTGYKIEMFVNQSITLSRQINYGKIAYFKGKLIERGTKHFRRLWEQDYKQRRIFEIENGNDPRAFALIDPQSQQKRFRMNENEIKKGSECGVFGDLHPILEIKKFGFEPVEKIQVADFLVNCRLRYGNGSQ
jgi:hypothetical protein